MCLLCNFEEEFGEDIWSKLGKEVASEMFQSVVALLHSVVLTIYIITSSLFDLYSFCCSITNYNDLYSLVGDTKFFACTGVFIGCNEFTTRILTSASLIRNPDDEAKIADDLKVGTANNSLTP